VVQEIQFQVNWFLWQHLTSTQRHFDDEHDRDDLIYTLTPDYLFIRMIYSKEKHLIVGESIGRGESTICLPVNGLSVNASIWIKRIFSLPSLLGGVGATDGTLAATVVDEVDMFDNFHQLAYKHQH
jgi:hypothetical protein